QNILAAPLVVPGNKTNAGRMRSRMVEVGRAAGRARRLADDPAGEVLAAGIAGRLADPGALLVLRAEPGDRHQREAVHQQDGSETGIDRRDLLGDDLQVDVADPAAAVCARQET